MKGSDTPEFGKCNFGSKPTAPAVLSQTQTTSLSNQTTQHITEIFGSTADAPVFGCQTTTAHPTFEGMNADGTCSRFGTPTETSTSNGGLFGQQTAGNTVFGASTTGNA
ncbi:unnamed protein product [Macrosiphum euphorbiae]|uniref:Uncharacterized protein n=1 Tax=Macrosiphum euphorbiae TaxID=13131 RepID=A0AAV0VS75_9HEMI|nr:unnamed protein product [Macrosiphum euphorbiae]